MTALLGHNGPDPCGAEPVPCGWTLTGACAAAQILAEARAAETLPWAPGRVSLYRTIFPQMTNWLPQEEGAQLRFEFATELARLKAA